MSKKYLTFFSVLTLSFSGPLFAQEDTLTIIGREINEVEVVARVEQPTDNHTTLSGKQLNEQNTGQNLPFLLSNTPSLVVTSDDGLGIGYTYFRVRGTDHTRINMTVNDVPLNDQESQTVFWVNITDMAGSLSSINVQRGVGTSTNGSAAFGASINMYTNPEQETDMPGMLGNSHVELGFNGGMYNTFREYIKAGVNLGNHWYFDGRFSKVNSDGYLERAASDLFSYHSSLGYYGDKTKVALTFFGGKEKTYMAWNGVTADDLKENRRYNPAGEYTDDNGNIAYYDNQTDNYWQQHLQLSLFQKLTSQLSFNATLHYTHGGGYYEQYKAGKKFSAFNMQPYYDDNGKEIKTDFVNQKHLNNHFYGGVVSLRYISDPLDMQLGTAVNNYNGQHFGLITYIKDETYPFEVPSNYYRNRGDKFDANVYAKANWRIIHKAQEQLTLYTDFQFRHVNYRINGINDEDFKEIPIDQTFKFFNPKAGLTYRNHGHQTYFNFAIANREPSRKNYTEAGIHYIPKAETLYDYELGYTYSHSRFHIGANLYFMDYDNQLVLTGRISDTGAPLTVNVKDSYRTGIELTAGVLIVDIPVRDTHRFVFDWEGNLTLSRNRILNFSDWIAYDYDDDNQVEVNFGNVDIAFSPSITAASVFSFDVAGFHAELQTNVIGKQYLDNTMSKEAMLKAYTTTNLTMQYTLPLPKNCPDITLRCQLNNMFDAKYESNGGNWMSLLPDGTYYYSPWYYAQAGINVHAGFVIRF